MLHIIASLSFTVIALGASALVVAMVLDAKDAILTALGVRSNPLPRIARRSVRVRAVGRWQAASAPQSWRAAA
jgi:hypothetical protein